jgi:hypothetical protein
VELREAPPERSRTLWKAGARRLILIGLIVLVVAVLVLSIYLGTLVQSQSRMSPPCGLECGAEVALSDPRVTNASGHWVYNFTVQSSGGGLDLDNLAFQAQNPYGGVITPTGSWTLSVFSIGGAQVGSFDWATGSWMAGGTVALTSEQSIAFGSGSVSLAGVGDNFLVLGVGSFQGSVEVAIP